MNIQESYYKFLAANSAKEKVEKVITKQIEEWKQQPYYEWRPTINDFGDTSGSLDKIYGKTIGEMCNTDGKVLIAYSGNSEATYVSHCGLSYKSVAEEISDDINEVLFGLYQDWIRQNREELFAELGIKDYDETWDDFDMYIAVREHPDMVDDLNYDWFNENFKQYYIGKDGQTTDDDSDLVFRIND